MTMVDNDVIEAFRIAEQEMQDEWERRQADVAKGLPYRSGPQVVAAHWLIVFAPSRCGLVQAGVPIGNVLDIVKEEGREFASGRSGLEGMARQDQSSRVGALIARAASAIKKEKA